MSSANMSESSDSQFFRTSTGIQSGPDAFGLVSNRASLTSWGDGASLALVGNPSSDGVTIKMPYPPRL